MTRATRLCAALAVVGLLGGCVGLHADDRIRPGLAVDAQDGQPVVILPEGPRPGATPEDVIRGFLRAGGVSGDAIAGAKSYLTTGAAARWNPDVGTVVVQEGSAVVIDGLAGRYRLTATPVGTLTADGRYTPAAPGSEPVRMDLMLTEVGGEWRISDVPKTFGRWLSPSAFAGLMRQVTVNYVATGSASLVPDVRWVVSDRMATRMVRQQLGAVPNYLTGAVRTDLGGGVHLLVDSVPVSDGIATVNLAGTGITNDSAARRNIWAQLVSTVTQAPGVVGVDVTVEGTRLALAGIDAPVATLRELGIDSLGPHVGVLPLVRVGQGLYSVDPSQVEQSQAEDFTDRTPVFPAVQPYFDDLAANFTGQEVAAVDQGELARFRADSAETVPNFGTDLTAPAYDRMGALWVGGRLAKKPNDAAVWAVNSLVWPATDPDAAAVRIPADWLTGRLPVALSVSVDGSRIAIVSTDRHHKDARLDVAGIVRAANGLPTALAATPLRLGPQFASLRDVTWIDDTTLSVLGSVTKDVERPFLVTLGQEVTPLPAVKGALALTTLGGERRLVVRTKDRVFVRAGAGWLPAAGSDLIVPGR